MQNETEIEKLARMVAGGFAEMRDGFAEVNKRFDAGDARIDAVEKQLDAKMDRVQAGLDTHRQETKDGFAGVHRLIGGVSTTLADHEERIKALED